MSRVATSMSILMLVVVKAKVLESGNKAHGDSDDHHSDDKDGNVPF